ncbi:MAG: MFS transporter [Bacteroidales bacterium]|nr:MFS transporter [Bacteroidales bacterium]
MKNKIVPEGYLFTRGYTNYVFVLLFLLYMFDYVDRMVITSLFPFLKADWGLTDTQCGMLVSAVYWSIVLFTFPVSILVDRWSRRKTIGLMALVWSAATGLSAFSRTFRQLFYARSIIGVGEAGYAPGGSAMISALYPSEKRSWMMGLWNASIPLGSAIGVALGGLIAAKLGWRQALGIVAIPGMIVAVLFFFVKDYKTIGLVKENAVKGISGATKKVRMSVKDMFAEFISKPSLIFTYFGMAGVVFTTTSLLTWLPTYFHRVQGVPEAQAGLKSSAVMLFAIIGAPLGGFIADRWRKKRVNARMLLPAITTLLSAFLMFMAFSMFDGQMQYMLLLSVGISITAFISAAAAVTQDVVHAGLRAISYAIAVVVQNLLGASLGPIAMGAISDATNIQTAFSLLPIALLIAAALFFIGSFFYAKDLKKVQNVVLEAVD